MFIQAQSGHTLFVKKASGSGMPPEIDAGKYTHFWVVRNFDESGVIFFYVARGYKSPGARGGEKEYHVWYRNGKMWSSYATSMKSAIDGAQQDGWKDAA